MVMMTSRQLSLLILSCICAEMFRTQYSLGIDKVGCNLDITFAAARQSCTEC